MTGITWNAGVVEAEANRAVKIVGLFVLKTLASRGKPWDTGTLLRSYSMEGPSRGTVTVGTNVDYAAHQEFGTIYQSGTPHLFPALAAAQAKYGGSLSR